MPWRSRASGYVTEQLDWHQLNESWFCKFVVVPRYRGLRCSKPILAGEEKTGASTPRGDATGAEARSPHPNDAINQPGFPPRIYFDEIKGNSLNILVTYWYHPPDQWAYLEHAHRINLEIVERCKAEGIEFAVFSPLLHDVGESAGGRMRQPEEKRRGLPGTLRR